MIHVLRYVLLVSQDAMVSLVSNLLTVSQKDGRLDGQIDDEHKVMQTDKSAELYKYSNRTNFNLLQGEDYTQVIEQTYGRTNYIWKPYFSLSFCYSHCS